jgi:hypothetical protein
MYSFSSRKALVVTAAACCLLLCSSLAGKPVDRQQAEAVAQAFLGRRAAQQQRGFSIASARDARRIAGLREIRDDGGNALAYVVRLEPQGFVAASADTGMAPIIAYSFRHDFASGDEGNPLFRMLKEDMRLRRIALAGQPALMNANSEQWKAYAQHGGAASDARALLQWPPEGATSTGGWLETTWDQGPPYNVFCPLDPIDGSRSYVGCVATAFAQIVNYHRECAIAFGPADAYTTPHGIDLDAESALYDFPSFTELNDYMAAVQSKHQAGIELDDTDIAALSFACGVAVEMDYSSEGSGAWTVDVSTALRYKFGFHTADTTHGLSNEMTRLLQENLVNGLPAVLTIREPNGFYGHAIVCDGYNTEGEYHLNFGWGSDRPEAVTEAWYRLPMNVPTFLNVVVGTILNIQPDRPGIDVEPASLSFYSLPAEDSDPRTLHIRSNEPNMVIDGIRAPEGFLVAGPNGVYSDRLDAFAVEDPNREALVYVKFGADAPGGTRGVLEIRYNGDETRYVPLDGCAFSGGTVVVGEVSGRWSQDNSPYFVAGDIVVPKDGVLMIESGVQVMFVGPYSMTVGPKARLVAMGNSAGDIEFSAWNRETGWTGLRFWDSGDDDILRHCVITYASKDSGITTKQDEEEADAEPVIKEGDPNACGGAVYCYRSDPQILNCKIANNRGDMGGAVYCFRSSPVIANTVLANNLATGGVPQCGGIYSEEESVPRLENCTIVNNSPGGIFSYSWEGMILTNTIVWGNDRYQIEVLESAPTVSFCNVQGGYPGDGNIDADPCFLAPNLGVGLDADGAAAVWTLKNDSPCVNAGCQADLPALDLIGNPRVYSDVIDIGAYENQSELCLLTISPSVTLDAGFVHVDANSSLTPELTNTGRRDVKITGVNLTDPNGVFFLLTAVRNVVLSPGESLPLEIDFAPTKEVTYGATLYVHSTADNGAHKSIRLRGTGVSGTIIGAGPVRGTWTMADNPHAVTGDIYVPMKQSLSIEPGVRVEFAGHFGLTVGYGATLEAIGTADENILFTAVDTREGWFGIRFVNTGDDDTLQYCTIERARKRRTDGGGYLNLMGGAILCCGSDEAAPGYIVQSSPWIDHCLIAHNEGEYGGGITVVDHSRPWITNCTIVDNTSNSYGGGMLIYGAAGLIVNNVIAHNFGVVSGGLTIWYSAPTFSNNTVVHNRPNGLHLHETDVWLWNSVPIVNNIVWENEIYVEEKVRSSEYLIRFNNMQGNWGGQGNLSVDPLFADPANRDYHLKSQAGRWDPQTKSWVVDEVTSPCVDTGDPESPVGEELSPHGDRLNMGAYGGTAEASKSPPDERP